MSVQKTVTCLAIGDPHFQVNNVIDVRELIDKVTALVDNLAGTLDFVVILGDLLHTHEKIHTVPFNLATEFITSIASRVQVFLLIGNHDYINNQQFLTTNHPFTPFKGMDNITVCDSVVVDVIDGHKFVFCPYVPPGRFEEALNTVGDEWRNAQCIFAHQEFYGCRFNPTMTSTEGDLWPVDTHPYVVSGHIHPSQQLQKNIYYVGSSMFHSFGETGKKTLALLTFEGDTRKLQKIDLEMRKKEIVYKSVTDAATFVPKSGAQVKLVIKGSLEEIKTFRKSKNYARLVKSGLAMSFLPVVDNVLSTQIVTTRQGSKKTMFQILESLVDMDTEDTKASFNQLRVRIVGRATSPGRCYATIL